MTLTLRRIAEIERHIPIMFPADDAADFLELVRLARLGLAVEAAPVVGDFPWLWAVPPGMVHKRVALVVLKGSK